MNTIRKALTASRYSIAACMLLTLAASAFSQTTSYGKTAAVNVPNSRSSDLDASTVTVRGAFSPNSSLDGRTLVSEAVSPALSYLVNTDLDNESNGCGAGLCTLREAVIEANANFGADTVNFDPTFFATAKTIVLTGGELAITDQLTINGSGANLLAVSGNNVSRIFFLNNATVSISGMSLTGGNGGGSVLSGDGGAVLTDNGAVTLSGVHVTGNTATGNSGGVYFINGNNQVLNSTFSGNTAAACGGFYNFAGTLAVSNSTISGNTSNGIGGVGGGLCSDGNTTLRSVTITGNTAANGGGIFNGSNILDVGNSIVAGNTASVSGDDFFADVAPVTSGYNLIGDNDNVSGTFPTGNPNGNQDIVGTPAIPVNPLLAPLANNGGPTPTHAYASIAAPGIDKGIFFSLSTDQRGFFRPIDRSGTPNAISGDGADIGAYELQNPTAALVLITGRVTAADGRGISKAFVTLAGGELASPRIAMTNPFGYYRFVDVPVGQTYIVSVGSKRFRFADPTRVINLSDDLAELDFIANP